MSNSNNTSIGFPALLLLTFIILKLTGFIEWSWWWVMSPFWIHAGIALILGLIHVYTKD